MSVIDEESPDTDRLEALKAMFYAVNKAKTSDKERIVEYQLWQIAKSLKSGELMLLRSIHEYHAPTSSYHEWADHMAKVSGFEIQELLELHEKRLVEMLLVSPRFQGKSEMVFGPLNGINPKNNRLTRLGVRFCRNIETYRIDLRSADGSQSN
jgi:hypothetical protein